VVYIGGISTEECPVESPAGNVLHPLLHAGWSSSKAGPDRTVNSIQRLSVLFHRFTHLHRHAVDNDVNMRNTFPAGVEASSRPAPPPLRGCRTLLLNVSPHTCPPAITR